VHVTHPDCSLQTVRPLAIQFSRENSAEKFALYYPEHGSQHCNCILPFGEDLCDDNSEYLELFRCFIIH